MGDGSINVETGGLVEFARGVRSGTGELADAAAKRSSAMQAGVTFGQQNASGAVHVAKERYAQALAISLANLEQFVRAAKIMADAAEKIAAQFDAVDARSADAVTRVNALMAQARVDVDAAQRTNDQAKYQFGPYQESAL
jgi:hypothetical protein